MPAQTHIIAATRSAIGSFGGSLAGIAPTQLGAQIARAAIARSGVAAGDIDHAVIGNVIHTESRDMYIARAVSIGAGMAESAPALTVNRLCGSGLQAIVSAAQLVMLGDAKIALAGGVEVMSRAGHLLPDLRFGKTARLGDMRSHDMLLGALQDPFGGGHMGVTAENVADDYGITRQAQDDFALASHRRAAEAQGKGYFKEQITPIEVASGRKTMMFESDEHIREDATAENLAGLKAIFKEGGSVTAGNSSGINDGAAALVLGDEAAAKKHGSLARIIGYGFGGVAPRIMGMGPVPASRMALEKAGIGLDALDVIESNEAFAAQACAVANELGFDPARVNPNGGAIALGHPIGATGAIIATKLVYELRRRKGRYGMATMCIGGGQGISLVVDCDV